MAQGGTGNSLVIQSVIDAGYLSQTVTVSESIAQGEVVNSDGSKANSATVAKRNKAVGIANAAIANGFSGAVITDGIITFGSWAWVAGDIIYLNGTALSTTSPTTGFTQKIGVALSATIIELKIGEAVLL